MAAEAGTAEGGWADGWAADADGETAAVAAEAEAGWTGYDASTPAAAAEAEAEAEAEAGWTGYASDAHNYVEVDDLSTFPAALTAPTADAAEWVGAERGGGADGRGRAWAESTRLCGGSPDAGSEFRGKRWPSLLKSVVSPVSSLARSVPTLPWLRPVS